MVFVIVVVYVDEFTTIPYIQIGEMISYLKTILVPTLFIIYKLIVKEFLCIASNDGTHLKSRYSVNCILSRYFSIGDVIYVLTSS